MGRTVRLVAQGLMSCALVATSDIATKAFTTDAFTSDALMIRGAGAPGETMMDELNVGDQAPDFTLPGSDGKTYTLSSLKGKMVVLAWFPKAFTGG